MLFVQNGKYYASEVKVLGSVWRLTEADHAMESIAARRCLHRVATRPEAQSKAEARSVTGRSGLRDGGNRSELLFVRC
jgi:hypothetical protein